MLDNGQLALFKGTPGSRSRQPDLQSAHFPWLGDFFSIGWDPPPPIAVFKMGGRIQEPNKMGVVFRDFGPATPQKRDFGPKSGKFDPLPGPFSEKLGVETRRQQCRATPHKGGVHAPLFFSSGVGGPDREGLFEAISRVPILRSCSEPRQDTVLSVFGKSRALGWHAPPLRALDQGRDVVKLAWARPSLWAVTCLSGRVRASNLHLGTFRGFDRGQRVLKWACPSKSSSRPAHRSAS